MQQQASSTPGRRERRTRTDGRIRLFIDDRTNAPNAVVAVAAGRRSVFLRRRANTLRNVAAAEIEN